MGLVACGDPRGSPGTPPGAPVSTRRAACQANAARFSTIGNAAEVVGQTPGLRGTPSSRIRNNGVSVLQGASRPTGASAAVQGDRPTIYAGAQHRKNEWH